MNQVPLTKNVIKRKILLIADLEHGSDISKNINKQLVEMAQVGKILYGIEGCYWNSDFPNKNCYGLEDPFIHRFVFSLNSSAYLLNDYFEEGLKLGFPPFANETTKAKIKEIDTIFGLDRDLKPQNFSVQKFVLDRLFKQLQYILEENILQKYSFDLKTVGLKTGMSLKDFMQYIVNLCKNVSILGKPFKMDLRDHTFTYYAREIIHNTPNLSLVMFIGEEHLANLKEKLKTKIPECEIKIIEFSEIDKEIQVKTYPSDITALPFFSPNNKPLEQKVGEAALSSTAPSEPRSKSMAKNGSQY